MPTTGHDGGAEDLRGLGAKAAPAATKFLFAGYIAVALASVVLSWQRAPETLFEVAAGVVILSTVVSLVVRALSASTAIAAKFVVWAILCVTIGITGLFISSAFFGLPERGAVIFARLLQEPSLAATRDTTPSILISAADRALWPTAVETPPDRTGDSFDQVSALSHRPSVSIDHAIIKADGPVLYFNTLTLNGGIVDTDGQDLRIEALRLISNGGSIKSFEQRPPTVPGRPGRPGGRVVLVVYEKIQGQLNVDLAGGDGAIGEKGRPGGRGRDGEPGENSAQGFLNCSHGGGQGHAGQPGAPGGDGGPGQPGGDGGTLVLQGPNPDELAKSIVFAAKGGIGGPGGAGGEGGSGGHGGPGGHGGGFCGGGQAGPNGPDGSVGNIGPHGRQGEDGPPPLKIKLAGAT